MDAKHVVVVEFACLNCGYMKLCWCLLNLVKNGVVEFIFSWCCCCC